MFRNSAESEVKSTEEKYKKTSVIFNHPPAPPFLAGKRGDPANFRVDKLIFMWYNNRAEITAK